VSGNIEVRGLGPLGAALGEKETSSSFGEAFFIKRSSSSNKPTILNQIFKML
jgi:hypothetical protein